LGRLIVVSGPSGVGKSKVLGGVRERVDLHFSVSATTRPPRPGECDGVQYHFIDEAEFRRRIEAGDFLEWAEYNEHLYGTPRHAVLERMEAGDDIVVEIEVQGARQVRAAYPAAILVFVAPPAVDVLEERLRGRGDTDPATIAQRLDIAAEELAAAEGLFDHVVVNDDLDTAISQVAGILTGPQGDAST
jgi:guanylate kinase